MFQSAFILHDKYNRVIHRLPNFVTDEGVQEFLKILMQDQALGEDAAWYVGLCGLAATKATVLATLPAEPTSQGGYARITLARDSTDWPTANIAQVNGVYRIRSATLNFAAAGNDFSVSVHRLFICNDAAGTTGKLYAVSAQLPTGLLIADGQDYDVAYEFAFD